MAAHAGVFFFDGRPARGSRRAIERALEPVSPDGVSCYVADSLVMGQGGFHVWTGERESQLPHRANAGHVITWDGRLDNRDVLVARLGSDAARLNDAQLALAAFVRWGIDGFRLLIGDWSLVLWDGDRRTLHLARDYMGVRPLYYYVDDRAVMWSSNLGELAVRSGRADAIDERFVAGFMAIRFSTDVTPYRGIRAVPTSTCVTLAPGFVEKRRRFWTLDPSPIRYRDTREYEEQLRSLWAEAVGARLRVPATTVWAELSGGFDSSSIVCMASSLIDARRVGAAAVQPVSHATLESPEGDERRFIAEVERQTNTHSHILGVEAHEDLTDEEWDWVTPYASRGVGLATIQHVRERGGRVVLSGRVGDLVMGCDPQNFEAVIDDVAEGHPLRALGNIRQWSRTSRKPFIEIAGQVMAEIWGTRISGVTGPSLTPEQHESLALLTPPLRQALPVHRGYRDVCPRPRASRRRLISTFFGYAIDGNIGIPSHPPGIIYSYPYTHRPLVEFVFAIPGEELSAPGQIRSLMCRAFADLLPARILRRRSKGHYPPSAMRATRARAEALLPVTKLELVQRNWLDATRLEQAVRALLDGNGRWGADVRRVMRLEKWLAAHAAHLTGGIPQREEVTRHEVLNA